MKFKTHIAMIVPLMLIGCAAYELQPLSMNHPANPEATAAPARTVSKTLAYTRADIPSTQPVADAAMPQGHETQQAAQGAPQTVVADGKVIATVPNASQIVVEHGEIKGFMDAMTMGYRVEPPSLLEGLKFGDKVRFTIDVPKKAIVKIEKGHVGGNEPATRAGISCSRSRTAKDCRGRRESHRDCANASQIVVEHGEIKGFMEAMTMGYRVDPPSLLEGLKFGDKVRFTIDVPKKAIVKIEKLG